MICRRSGATPERTSSRLERGSFWVSNRILYPLTLERKYNEEREIWVIRQAVYLFHRIHVEGGDSLFPNEIEILVQPLLAGDHINKGSSSTTIPAHKAEKNATSRRSRMASSPSLGSMVSWTITSGLGEVSLVKASQSSVS